MLTHRIIINVSDPTGKKVNVLKGANLKIRNRFLTRLFSKEHKMLVLVPGEIVESVAIKEIKMDEAVDHKKTTV